MHLKRLHIENNGPLANLDIELPTLSDGRPKPLILVGGNGSGKTNLLSIIADALFEAAAAHYQNVVPSSGGLGRSWFRLVGATTFSVGAPGGFSVLEFDHAGSSLFFKEKGGRVVAKEVAARMPDSLRGAATWPDEGNVKEFSVNDELAGKIFEDGIYVYFPSSRAEVPHWLNRESVPSSEFDLALKIQRRLRKPIYVEEALDRFEQWLLAVILESRQDVAPVIVEKEGKRSTEIHLVGNVAQGFAGQKVLEMANLILRIIVGDPEIRAKTQ